MTRKTDLAKIHIASAALGMETEAYRGMLREVGDVDSARDLDEQGRRRVLQHLHRLGWRAQPPAQSTRPEYPPERGPMIYKVDAMLLAAGRDRAYIEQGILPRMFGDAAPKRLEWCSPDQLRKVIAALNYDAKRRAGRAAR